METVHFIGIGGIGMSALARILLQRGYKVSGSDLATSSVVDALRREGAIISIGNSAQNVHERVDLVAYSTDISRENPEYEEAKKRGIPLLHRSELLAKLMEGSQSLLVTGTHGKTTTSSLLAHVLLQANLNPSYALGGIVRSLHSNGGHGSGKYFVAEADESDGSFLKYPGFGAIITNIDRDHLDYWETEQALSAGFKDFASHITSPKHLFWCKDDDRLASLNLKGISYGFSEEADLCIESYSQMGWNTLFDLTFEEKKYSEIEIPLIGGHNVLNASAVFGFALKLRIPEKKVRLALSAFQGVSRRAEKKGEEKGIVVYDDYAHHPTEIYATLRAIKLAAPEKRLVVAFQPHRYTRTRDCFEQFSEAFKHADELLITDIYAARETPIEGITIENLVSKIGEKCKAHVQHISFSDLSTYLAHFLEPGDLLVTMGAGDITKIGSQVLEQLKL